MAKRKPVVLVVDDDPDILQVMKGLLRTQFRVLVATSGEDGLEIMEENHVDLVVSDQRMPGMEGDAFLARVAGMRPDTVRMLYTAYSDIGPIINAVNRGGIYHYFTKPAEPREIIEVLHKAAVRQAAGRARRLQLVQDLQESNDLLKEGSRKAQAMIDLLREENRIVDQGPATSST